MGRSITPENYKENLAIAYHEHFENLQTIEVGQVALKAYAEIFATCRQHGIVAVAVITPEASDFRSWYGINAQKAVTILMKAANEGTDGHVVDAREWLPDSVFADGHHVSRAAALMYSSRLSRDALVPALRHSPVVPGECRRVHKDYRRRGRSTFLVAIPALMRQPRATLETEFESWPARPVFDLPANDFG